MGCFCNEFGIRSVEQHFEILVNRLPYVGNDLVFSFLIAVGEREQGRAYVVVFVLLLFLSHSHHSACELADGSSKNLYRERLEQASVETLATQLRHDARLVGGDSNKLYFIIVFAYALHYFSSVHLGHFDVGEHNVWSVFSGESYSLLSVCGSGDIEADALYACKHLKEQLLLQTVVVDNQHLHVILSHGVFAVVRSAGMCYWGSAVFIAFYCGYVFSLDVFHNFHRYDNRELRPAAFARSQINASTKSLHNLARN